MIFQNVVGNLLLIESVKIFFFCGFEKFFVKVSLSLPFFLLVSVLSFKKILCNLDHFIISLCRSYVIKRALLAPKYFLFGGTCLLKRFKSVPL